MACSHQELKKINCMYNPFTLYNSDAYPRLQLIVRIMYVIFKLILFVSSNKLCYKHVSLLFTNHVRDF